MPKIAIEYDTEDQQSYIGQVQSMVSKLGFESALLTSEQIINGELQGFDAVIFPGGFGAFYGLRHYEDFGDAVRYFVANGGGYLGCCGGAYVTGLRVTEAFTSLCPRPLGLIDVEIYSPPWIKFWQNYQQAQGKRVAVSCQITSEAHPIVSPNQGQAIELVYSGGPLMRNPGPSVTTLLTYLNGLMTPGDIAMCCSQFGRGRVVISSPHPETPWGEELVGEGCQEWLYQQMISWVSQAEEESSFPFLPWLVKKSIAYPLIPTMAALWIGGLAVFGLVQLAKYQATPRVVSPSRSHA